MTLTNILEKITGSFCSCGNSNISDCFCPVHNERDLERHLEEICKRLAELEEKEIELNDLEIENKDLKEDLKNSESDLKNINQMLLDAEAKYLDLCQKYDKLENTCKQYIKTSLPNGQAELIKDNVKLKSIINNFRVQLNNIKTTKLKSDRAQIIEHMLLNSQTYDI